VGDEDPGTAVGGQAVQYVGDQIGGGRLGPPRRCDDLHAGPYFVDTGAVEHDHVVRAFRGEQSAGVDRRRIQWVVVARQQVDGDTDGAHGFQGLPDHLRRELVVFEDVAGHDDELGAHFRGQRAERGHRVTAGRRITGLGVAGKEVPGHAQLPVSGVQEPHTVDPLLDR
jgi:hypothetical protein